MVSAEHARLGDFSFCVQRQLNSDYEPSKPFATLTCCRDVSVLNKLTGHIMDKRIITVALIVAVGVLPIVAPMVYCAIGPDDLLWVAVARRVGRKLKGNVLDALGLSMPKVRIPARLARMLAK